MSDTYVLNKYDSYKYDMLALLLCPKLKRLNLPGLIPREPERIRKINRWWHHVQLDDDDFLPGHDENNEPVEHIACDNTTLKNVLMLRLTTMERRFKRRMDLTFDFDCTKKLPIHFDHYISRSPHHHPRGCKYGYNFVEVDGDNNEIE